MINFTRSTRPGFRTKPGDYWLANGQKDWAYINDPLAKKLGVPTKTPIRLCVGNEREFGAEHIYKKQRRVMIQRLLQKHPSTASRFEYISTNETYAPEYAWLKLTSSGAVYTTEDEQKTKLVLAMHPNSLMILAKQDDDEGYPYFSVVTLYPVNKVVTEGTHIGRYSSNWVNPIINAK